MRLSQVICAIRVNNFCYKEEHYYMCSKSFYTPLLLGANLTSNTLETLRMEGSAFKISLYLHAKPILRNTTYLCNFFDLHNIYFFNFCMEISAEKKNSSKKRKKNDISIYYLVSINHQFEMTFCATVVERSTYLALFDKTDKIFTITCSLRADKNFFVIHIGSLITL